MLLGYMWLTGVDYTTALAQTTHGSTTIVEYFRYFRELVGDSLDEVDWKVGGEGVVVEIDESKFGKRKYNRGHRVEGAWVIGGIERTQSRKFFVRVVEKRDAETIVDVLRDHVLPGSIVHTDCWRGYVHITEDNAVVHRTVNHSMHFVDPETGVHTNSIEGKWAALKRKITLRGRVKETLPEYLFEQIWRTRNKGDLWNAFISSLREVIYE
jgi:transposase-like protein